MYKLSVANLKILKRFSSLLVLLKRDQFMPGLWETHKRIAHFRVPDIADQSQKAVAFMRKIGIKWHQI